MFTVVGLFWGGRCYGMGILIVCQTNSSPPKLVQIHYVQFEMSVCFRVLNVVDVVWRENKTSRLC